MKAHVSYRLEHFKWSIWLYIKGVDMIHAFQMRLATHAVIHAN
jgi:hypothetical protein